LASGEVVRDVATRAEPGTINGSTDQRLARFANERRALRGVTPKTVFIGDSLVERLPTYDPDSWKILSRKFDAANLGFSGDTTSSLLYRLQNGLLHGMNPSLVFLCVGTNNVGLTDNVDQSIQGIMTVIREIQRQLPDAKIVVSSILPRGAIGDDAFVPQINSQLSQKVFDEDFRHLRFSNAARAFLASKYRPGDFEVSSVHLTRSGYQRWVQVILQDLTQAATT
ncbi:MAG: acetylglucosamine-6-sulfatase, partial [Phycisphaerales bacterium]|nr:acetylglucosamine-6-sulfatase [Phycisphaerales bacterium]